MRESALCDSQNSGTEQSSLPTTTGEMEVRESTAASGFMLLTACFHAANMIATFPCLPAMVSIRSSFRLLGPARGFLFVAPTLALDVRAKRA